MQTVKYKLKNINGLAWPDIHHHYQDYFDDNLIMFESCPVESLSNINSFLSKKNLDPLLSSRFANPRHPFNKVNHIVFPVNRLQKVNYEMFETLLDAELYSLTVPLVNFMTKQINLKFKNYVPFAAEINILNPTVSIGRHTDHHPGVGYDFRMHLVLSTNDLVEFCIEDKQHYFSQGSCFVFNNTKEHEVHNNHPTLSRTHLIVDFCKCQQENNTL
jgi:hypothetical protein